MRMMVDAALRYAAHGWPVFPCEPRGKRPRTHNGLKDATTTPAVLERWWRADCNANIGVVTGASSGLVVLDIDGDEGMESLRGLERANAPLPTTASVVTPRGGSHFYFRHPGSEIRNSAGVLGPGLDVRGDGGYVLAPPSMGSTGRRYAADERVAPAELPPWLSTRLKTPQEARRRVPVNEWVRIVRGLPEGQRNHGIARLAGHLLAHDVDVRLVLELVMLVAARCQPALAAGEVQRVVESIAGRELRKRCRR